jgi:hypothetical protein
MQHSWKKDIEIVIIMKGRCRFLWEVQDHNGKVYAHGQAATAAVARVEAGLARHAVTSDITE